jgi:hypothetical protein
VYEATGVRVLLRYAQPQDEVVALIPSVERSKQVHERAYAAQKLEPLVGTPFIVAVLSAPLRSPEEEARDRLLIPLKADPRPFGHERMTVLDSDRFLENRTGDVQILQTVGGRACG